MIQKTMISFLLALVCNASIAQQMHCEYNVVQNADIVENGVLLKAITVEYKGHYYFKNNKVLTYIEPLYLDKYPNGQAKFQTPNSLLVYNFCTKPRQLLSTADFDSLIERHQSDHSPLPGSKGNAECEGNLTQIQLAIGSAPWIYLNETKTIAGLHCQRAKLYSSDNTLIWDLWFTNDIKIPGCTQGLTDLQGLMIEGWQAGTKNKYTLTSYTTNIDIPDEMFWPACFNGKFEPLRKQKKYTTSMKN